MNNYQKFGFIAGQFLAGLGFAIPGFILISLVVDASGTRLEMLDSFLVACTGGYTGMLIGTWYISYLLLKQMGMHNRFVVHALQSIGGLVIVFIVPYIIDVSIKMVEGTIYDGRTHSLKYILWGPILFYSMNILTPFIPLIATILGFNFRLFKNITKPALKNSLPNLP